MNEREVKEFWNSHPCGEELVGGVRGDYEEFFRRYDAYRYAKEAHILKCLDNIDFEGKHVLEIGLGLGADSEQIIRRGGVWSGIDLTPQSVERVKLRMKLHDLPYERIEVGSVVDLPFESRCFDMVFSHGVLHHVPEIDKAQSEIHRVLRPDGRLIVMLYAKHSLNNIVSIGIMRRVGLSLLFFLRINPGGMYGVHLQNAHAQGLFHYLRMKNFIHYNTDGPLNPYSKVYDLAEVRRDFPKFKVEKAYKEFMHAPPLPVAWLPFAFFMGWHLWVHMKPTT